MLPKSIQKAAEAAQKLYDETYNNKPEEEIKETGENIPTPEPESQEPPKEPESTPETLVEEKPQESAWEHKYRVLEGKYRAEVPRLHAENKELTQSLNALRSEFQSLRDELNQAKQVSQKKEPVSDDFLATYFSEEDSGKLAKYIQDQINAGVEARLADVRNEVGTVKEVAARTAQEAFWQAVLTTFPDYNELRENPALSDWLGVRHDFSDVTRYDLLLDSANRLNAKRFIEILGAFKQSQQPKPKADLTTKVAPQQSVSSSVQKQEPKRYTEQEYSSAMDRVRKLQLNRRYEEAAAIKKELDKAFSDGRVY